MRYVIYGAGAIGASIAGRLAAAGRDVLVIARGPHLEAMRRDGLRLQDPDGESVHRLALADGPGDVTDADVVLLTVKGQHAQDALDALAAVAEPAVVCAQNGVENERLALRRFARVDGMLVYCPAQLVEPGVVQAFSAPDTGVLDVGRFPTGVDATAQTVAGDLRDAGFAAQASERIMAFKHAKLVLNTPNAVDVVLGPGQRDGEVAERARAEAREVLEHAGIDVAGDAEMSARTGLLSPMRPVGGVEHSGSSTWQSITRGSGSVETDFLNGEIVLLGRLHGASTPVNAALARLARRVATDGLRPGAFTPEDVLGDGARRGGGESLGRPKSR